MNGINVKKAAPIIKRAASDGWSWVQRQRENLYISSGTVLIAGTEADLWDLVRVMPRPLPQGEGAWCARDGAAFHPEETSTTLAQVIEHQAGTKTFPLEDTGLVARNADCKNGTAILRLPDEYVVVNADLLAVFESKCEFRSANRRSPISAWCEGQMVGVVMPIITGSDDFAHLVPLKKRDPVAANA